MIRAATLLSASAVGAILAASASAAIVPGRVVAKVGDSIGAFTISGLENPFVDSAGRPGFLVALSNSSRSIWYGTGPVFNSLDALPDTVTGGEGSIGIGDGGVFIYSPTYNTNDAVYTDNGALLVETDPAPGRPGEFVSFASRPAMNPNGTAYWVGGWAATVGGASIGRALYSCTDTSNPSTIATMIQTGDVIDGVAAISAGGIGFTYDLSANGSNHIHRLILDATSTTNDVMYLDGAIVAREGSPAVGGDNYATFNALSVNDSGSFVFSSNTSGATTADEILVHDGAVLHREGQSVDGVTLGGTVDVANINNRGWVTFVWDGTVATVETLFAANPAVPGVEVALLTVNDSIDINGDNVGDFTLTDFNVSLGTASEGGFADNGYYYANVDLTPAGGGASVEAVIRVSVLQACIGDINFDFVVDIGDLAELLSGFGSTDGVGPADGDIDGDGDIDIEDLSRLLSSFGNSC